MSRLRIRRSLRGRVGRGCRDECYASSSCVREGVSSSTLVLAPSISQWAEGGSFLRSATLSVDRGLAWEFMSVSIVRPCPGVRVRRLRRSIRKTATATIANVPTDIPTPRPIFVPVDSPDVTDGMSVAEALGGIDPVDVPPLLVVVAVALAIVVARGATKGSAIGPGNSASPHPKLYT